MRGGRDGGDLDTRWYQCTACGGEALMKRKVAGPPRGAIDDPDQFAMSFGGGSAVPDKRTHND